VGFDPSVVSQIGRFLVRVLLSRSVRSPFVGFVSVMDKSPYKRLIKRSARATVPLSFPPNL